MNLLGDVLKRGGYELLFDLKQIHSIDCRAIFSWHELLFRIWKISKTIGSMFEDVRKV
jgi:hypothetical protein